MTRNERFDHIRRKVPFYAASGMGMFLIAIFSTIPVNAQEAITVETGSPSYQTGDTIDISGQLFSDSIDEPILVQVLDPSGNRILLVEVNAEPDGNFDYSLQADASLETDGVYLVLVSYKDISQSTTFDFDASIPEPGWQSTTVNIDSRDYDIHYKISGIGNDLVTIVGNPDSITLSILLDAQSDGLLSLRYNEAIFDANTFQALIDGAPSLVEDRSQGSRKEINIAFEEGTEEIVVSGDHIIPEFGIVAPGLSIAIVLATIVTIRYSYLRNYH